MNYSMVKVLMLKDWYLQRWTILGALLGGGIALGVVCLPGKAWFMIGLILLVSVLIAVGAQLAIAMIVQERKEQTLPFVMSLPVSYREYTTSKLLGTMLIFMFPWLVLVLGSLALFVIPHGVPHGLLPFTAIMALEILVAACMEMSVAVVTESQGWTVGAVMVGNVAFNLVGYGVAHIEGIAKGMNGSALMWSSAASATLVTEFAAIALILAGTFYLQSRKRDFI